MLDNLEAWFSKNYVAIFGTAGLLLILGGAFVGITNFLRSGELNAIVKTVLGSYPSEPYIATGSEDDTALILKTGEVPSTWATADGNDAKTPWGSDWSVTVAPNLIKLTVPGMTQETCLSEVRGVTPVSRLTAMVLNGNTFTVTSTAADQFNPGVQSLAHFCTGTNSLELDFQ